jgi:hypothetical protein
MTSISLYTPDVAKAAQLYKTLAMGTPLGKEHLADEQYPLESAVVRHQGNYQGSYLPYPYHQQEQESLHHRTLGNDTDNLAPTAISGDLLHQSISTLVPTALATKSDLPVLAADPLTLLPPPPPTIGSSPDRLQYIFTNPTFAHVITVLLATFSVPIAITAPLGWDFSTNKISKAIFPCKLFEHGSRQ